MSKKILVVDLEATCWEGRPPEGQSTEIIEIGLASVIFDHGENDYTFARTSPDSFFVRPERSEVCELCTELTGITPEMAAGGMSLEDALEKMRRLLEQHFAWASWGEWDKRTLRQECKDKGIKYPLPYQHVNIKSTWGCLNGVAGLPLGEAIREEGRKFIGRPHRANDDALNAARILRDIVESYGKGANK